jgi:hypothetical protein
MTTAFGSLHMCKHVHQCSDSTYRWINFETTKGCNRGIACKVSDIVVAHCHRDIKSQMSATLTSPDRMRFTAALCAAARSSWLQGAKRRGAGPSAHSWSSNWSTNGSLGS